MNPMHPVKRTLSALLLGGAALALAPTVAQAADGPNIQGPPIAKRVGDIVDHPAQTVQDTKTAVNVTAGGVKSAGEATDTSLSSAGTALGAGLPKPPKVG
ncbi:hypothetical protein AB0P15_19595 [Streptomyces sp. NPDC087917]|uniref:hypothetical protein n=1 Tax=Streptomyces sp. NPDC087917 TaxID=3155060 RepID=UPI00342E4E8D